MNKNHMEAALHALSGDTIYRLLYDIEIACTSDASEEKNNACKEIEGILMNIDITQSHTSISKLLKIK